MHAFVVLGLVFSIPSQEIGLAKRRNDLFYVNWDVKPQLYRPIRRCAKMLDCCCHSSQSLSEKKIVLCTEIR